MVRIALIFLLVACEHGKGGGPGVVVGGDCEVDADCPTRLCWDFMEHDQFCNGTICSIACTTTDECVDAAEAAGSTNPEGAFCGSDGECDLVSTGLGAFACAAN